MTTSSGGVRRLTAGAVETPRKLEMVERRGNGTTTCLTAVTRARHHADPATRTATASDPRWRAR